VRRARGPLLRTVRLVERLPALPPRVVTADVSAVCPRCGRPRGRVEEFKFVDHETQMRVTADRWLNSCGHVDLYVELLAEAARIAASQEGHNPG
jgi:hypothetical protein